MQAELPFSSRQQALEIAPTLNSRQQPLESPFTSRQQPLESPFTSRQQPLELTDEEIDQYLRKEQLKHYLLQCIVVTYQNNAIHLSCIQCFRIRIRIRFLKWQKRNFLFRARRPFMEILVAFLFISLLQIFLIIRQVLGQDSDQDSVYFSPKYQLYVNYKLSEQPSDCDQRI